ncbi:52 kDa repressor of the inhibitor of the protein kinase-like isoform X2 [Lepeophtheirus salmonis]|uniref:52 kDa repressor of the inhibitor of the protein kinase-like isoform X2 n=1 Tax=Lepeophtheirus salmonis TaxID=72036 RepID=UPI003AF34399
MPSCSDVDCRSRSGAEGIILFSFPRDAFLRRQWVIKMKRKLWKPSDNSRLCSKHFEENQFVKNSKGKKRLHSQAIPTLFKHLKPKVPRLTKNSNKPIFIPENNGKKISPLSQDHTYFTPNLEPPTSKNGEIDVVDRNLISSTIKDETSYNDISPEVRYLNVINANLQVQLGVYEAEIKELKKKLKQKDVKIRAAESKFKSLELRLSSLFNSDQIQFLSYKSSHSKIRLWSNKTIKNSLQLRFTCGTSGYQMLLNQGYPLPSNRTLQRNLKPGTSCEGHGVPSGTSVDLSDEQEERFNSDLILI